MASTRRRFIQLSAAVASAATLPAFVFAEAHHPSVRAVEDKLIKARPIALGKVRILGGPLKTAQDLTAKYLLELDPDRMMAYYRVRRPCCQRLRFS